jgi:two-component system OmpR family response regulator
MGNNILIIDDDPDICEIVSMALSKKGFAVRTAMSGEQGISVAHKHIPDIVLLDNTLPDMDGKDVARRIKGTAGGNKVIIVMMTGKEAPKGEIDTSLYSGCLKKPFRLSDMVDYIEKISREPHLAFDVSGTDHYYCPGHDFFRPV